MLSFVPVLNFAPLGMRTSQKVVPSKIGPLPVECIFCYSIRSKLGARTRFTRNISTIDGVTTTEHVTPPATHARYEGEAQARPSASAVFYHPKHYFVVFAQNYGLFRRILFSLAFRRSTDSSRNNGVATKRERKAKIPLELYFFTSCFPVDRLRTCFLLSDESGKNNPRGDVKGTVKRAARTRVGTVGDHQGNRAACLFSTCVCG